MDPIISVAVEAAGKWVTKEVKRLCGVKKEVEEMKVELQWMQSFLEDADNRLTSQSQQRQSQVFHQSVLQVREASLDAEDAVDTYLLKTCFLYLSQFPEDYEIQTNALLRMWMAEGLVSVKYDGEGEETVEDVAERYLNELVGRRMVEVGKKGFTGRVKTCRLHDLMREMCLSNVKEEGLIHSYERDAVTKGKMRRLSFIGFEEEISLSSGYDTYSHIRSLIIRNIYRGLRDEIKFKLLKMLLLEGVDIEHMKGLSKQIAKLIHLRYLSLRDSMIYDWPSLDKLGCMETLDLRVHFVYQKKHPLKLGEIWKMKQLRHLYLPEIMVRYSTDGDSEPVEINRSLHTLVDFPLPNHKIGGILIKFPNLRRLRLCQAEHVVGLQEILNKKKDFSFNRLHSFTVKPEYEHDEDYEKVDLEAVVITCPHLYKLRLQGTIDKFPQLNQFPAKLTKLLLKYSGIEDPKHIEATLGNLPHLRSLELWEDSFKGERLSFKKNTFPQLTVLALWRLHELKNWTVEKGAMPNLERVEIHKVHKLEAVPEGLRYIATLKELRINEMPTKFKARLKEGGDDFDTVKYIPSITYYDADFAF